MEPLSSRKRIQGISDDDKRAKVNMNCLLIDLTRKRNTTFKRH